MSTCVSSHGEYSAHTLDADYVCTFCGVLDEEALIAELRQLRVERDDFARLLSASDYALRNLVHLKDGLRDEGYAADKGAAWNLGRQAVAAVDAHRGKGVL